jgi:hypothetical protein
MSCLSALYMSEDNDVILDKLRKSHAETYVNDATVTCVLKDAADVEVIGETSMLYVTDSDGQYRGVFDAADLASLTEGATYYIECAIASGTFDGFRRVAIEAGYHGAA